MANDAVTILQQSNQLNSLINGSSIVPNKFWPGGVMIDVRLQESYTYQAEITTHAVEAGVIFSDHMILRPARVDLSVEVSNFDGLDKTKKAFADFLNLWLARKKFDLILEHKMMEDMLCFSIQVDNSVPEWGKLSFRVGFQQVKFVSLETTKMPSVNVKGYGDSTGGPVFGNSAQSPTSSGTQKPTTISKSSGKSGIFTAGGGSFVGSSGVTGNW